MTKHPEPPPDDAGEPVPNRRERRGGKSEAPSSYRGGKVVVGRKHGAAPNPRQYSNRRRG